MEKVVRVRVDELSKAEDMMYQIGKRKKRGGQYYLETFTSRLDQIEF